MNLTDLALGAVAVVTRVGGMGSFRRRLMELGMLPGTRVEVVGIAPLGDPLELLVRGSSLSIRRAEALSVEVELARKGEIARERQQPSTPAKLVAGGCVRGTP